MRVLKQAMVAAVLTGFLAMPAFAGSPRSDIEAALKIFVAAFNSGDAATVARLYTEDAALLPPGGKRVDGRKGVEEFWGGAIKNGVKNLSLTALEVENRDDMAFEVGAFSLDAPGEGGAVSTVIGKYIVVWMRGDDGTWRLHRDIWNTGAAK